MNGGQTTSSIYFASRQNRKLDLSRVMVPAKIIVLKDKDDSARDKLISDISRYANSQNAVKSSDLSANRPFHVQLEKLANDTWCPDGTGRWFYERASGAYQVLLPREATTPAQKKKLRDAIPTSRKLSKNDIAKYFEAWRCKPAQVAMAGEKNFAAFMKAMDETPHLVPTPLDARWYREMIAKVIIFKATQHMISRTESKRIFRQGWVNITTYTVSVLSDRMGDKLDFEQVWLRQGISQPLRDLLWNWAVTVNETINDFAPGRQVSEVAKHPDLWARVQAAKYAPASAHAPEFR